MTIIIFLAVLAVLILVHEFGHFITAKKLGIRVDEFGLGFPPRAVGLKRGETIYSLNWIPFGGFVKIFGEDPDAESIDGPDRHRSFVHKPRWVQATVLLAGIGCNILFAWLLLSVGFMIGQPTAIGDAAVDVSETYIAITGVEPGSPAEAAGLQTGDQIVSLARGEETIMVESVEDVRTFVSSGEETPVQIVYTRDGEVFSANVQPMTGIVSGRPAIGIAMDAVGIVRLPPHRAIIMGATATGDIFIRTIDGFGTLIADLFRGRADLEQVSGPIGIAVFVGNAADFGFVYLMSFVAFISINLAVINLIPFPALDGGRVLFVALEAIRRRPINPQVANTVNAVGFVLLIGLMLVVTYGDIVRLF